MESEIKKKNWASHQRNWYGKWHVWLGLIAGSIIFIVSITGTILVYRDEIDMALNPEIFEIDKGKEHLSFQKIVSQLKTDHPGWEPIFIFKSESGPNYPYRLILGDDKEKQIYVNPFNGEVTGARIHDSHFIGLVTEIHRTLLIPVVGRYIVGISALILVILTISGLRLWIPKQWKHLKSRHTIKRKASLKRQNYDLHQVLGFYFAPMVTLIALTGVVITFLNILAPIMFLLSFEPPKSLEQIMSSKSVYEEGYKTIPIDSVVAIAETAIPDCEVVGLGLPMKKDTAKVFTAYTESPYVTETGNNNFMYIDQYSGKINFNTNSDLPNTGKMYLNWVTPVHYGTFGGNVTRVLAFIATLIPPILFITGIVIWLPRWKGKKKRKANSDYSKGNVQRRMNAIPKPVISNRKKENVES
ncbi:PepSY-associated TM helix domain-containing protein [Chondrinema litorale]|uniref:PepSY-associated TM helix domain-containing protein n=1 Tax=Chondrinema litorale TaxID=2994555 RepID=UPI002542CD40|nr:PepSY-associated TM helix domain-containing protein [Chondrinema litorale]UZR96575.1 PepSY-associated TM helix domain-containing protein [Chondrinema litorale]